MLSAFKSAIWLLSIQRIGSIENNNWQFQTSLSRVSTDSYMWLNIKRETLHHSGGRWWGDICILSSKWSLGRLSVAPRRQARTPRTYPSLTADDKIHWHLYGCDFGAYMRLTWMSAKCIFFAESALAFFYTSKSICFAVLFVGDSHVWCTIVCLNKGCQTFKAVTPQNNHIWRRDPPQYPEITRQSEFQGHNALLTHSYLFLCNNWQLGIQKVLRFIKL